MVWCLDEPLDRVLKQVDKRFGNVLERCGGVHDLLLYETPKIARIRDAKLGLFYYLLVACIIVYLFIQLHRNMEFLEQSVPSQSVRLEFREPVANNQRELQDCEPLDDPDCKEVFRDIKDIPYCCTEKCKPHPLSQDPNKCQCPDMPVHSFQCRLTDGISASQITSNSIFIKTFRKFVDQQRNPDAKRCDIDHGRCDELWQNQGKTKEMFTADIERFRLLIDHSVTLDAFDISSTVRDMDGYLRVGVRGNSTARHHRLCRERDDAVDSPYRGQPTDRAPCFIRPMFHREGDMFEFGVLLQAMNISLDDATDEGRMSYRERGFIVNMEVVYFNTRRWHLPLKKVHYYYKLIPERRNQHDIEEVHVDNQYNEEDPSLFKRRTVEVSRGVFMTVTRGGFLAQFNFQHLLVTLTTGLALLTVATYIVTWVARFLMRWGNYYNELIYDTSGSFLHMDDLANVSDVDVDKALASRDLDVTGSREQRVMRLLESDWTLKDHNEGEMSPLVQMDRAPGSSKKGSKTSSYGTREVTVKEPIP